MKKNISAININYIVTEEATYLSNYETEKSRSDVSLKAS